jgi:general stress protein 26
MMPMDSDIEKYVKELELRDSEIHRLRNRAQVTYALVGEAVIFFEAVKADYKVPEELRKLAKIWLTDYYDFFPQPEPIHTQENKS